VPQANHKRLSYIKRNLCCKGIPSFFPSIFLTVCCNQSEHAVSPPSTPRFYREHISLTVAFFCLRAPGGNFCLRAVGAFGLRAISLVARRAFITGEFLFGGSPGLLLQVNSHDG